MSEIANEGARSARREHGLWDWCIRVLLLLVAFWFRTYRLADVPPGLHHDDIKNVLLVKKIMAGDVRIYYEENYGHEPLYHWLQAAYMSLVGTGYPEVRLLSAGISMAGLALIYALAKRLMGQSALWVLAWQAVSLWPLFYSRRAIRGVLLPPLAALTGYLFVVGLEQRPKQGRRWGTWALGGITLAACLYTYMGSRTLPLFFLLLAIYVALYDRPRFKACWQGLAVFFVIAIVLSLPLGAYLISHPEERVGQIGAPLDALKRGEWQPLLENSLRALGMFTFTGDPHWRQFVADTPVFEFGGAILFYAGLVLSVWRWRRLEYAFSLLWLPLALAPAMLSEGAPNFLRPIAVQVTVYLFPAQAVAEIRRWVDRRTGHKWAWAVVVVAVALLGFNAWRTYDGYFVRWSRHPDARFAYNSTLLEESRYLDGAGDLRAVVLSGHFAADLDPALVDSFLRRTDLALRWCDIRQSLIYPGGEDAYVVEPNYLPIDPLLRERLVDVSSLVHKRRLGDGSALFAVYPLERERVDASLAVEAGPVGWSDATVFPDGRPDDWAFVSLPATFGDRVALVQYEVSNGGRASAGDVVTVLTFWRVVQPGPATAITFLHLLSPEGMVIAGYDGFGAPPNRWCGDDLVVQVHRLALPGDLRDGAYPIELGWYERDTAVRWKVQTAEGEQPNRLLLQPVRVGTQGG